LQRRLARVLCLVLVLATTCTAERLPRIAILTISTGVIATPYIAQTVVNKALYANYNSYRFLLFNHLDRSRPPSWSKILALKTAILSRNFDWLVWLDGDMVITNFGTRVESMLPFGHAIDLLVSQDCDDLNMGAFVLRSSQSALDLLEEIYGGPHVTEEILQDRWWEQKSFIALYAKSEGVRNRTMLVPQRMFNSYPPTYSCHENGTAGWLPGDFAIHFPGSDESLRNRLVPEYLKKVIYE